MKRNQLLLLLLFTMLVWMPVRASFVINGGTYRADTLVHRQVGPGMINTIVRLPQYPLNIYVVAVDLNNPNKRYTARRPINEFLSWLIPKIL